MQILAIEPTTTKDHYSVTLLEGKLTQSYGFAIEHVNLSGQTVLLGQWDAQFEKDFLYQTQLHGLISRLVLKYCSGSKEEQTALPINVDNLAPLDAGSFAASA
jgi:hypothetical protein